MITLSKRESEILDLLSEGHTSSEISGKLFLSKHTVEWHRKNLLKKFNASNTTILLKNAEEKGLLHIRNRKSGPIIDKKLEILLAEDDEIEQQFFRTALRFSTDHNLSCVHNGKKLLSFLEKKRSKKPDVIFLDLNMPVMNGIEVLAELKKNDKYREIPVFIYASPTSPEVVSDCFKSGASLFITKSADFENVIVLVQSLCNLFNKYVKFPFYGVLPGTSR